MQPSPTCYNSYSNDDKNDYIEAIQVDLECFQQHDLQMRAITCRNRLVGIRGRVFEASCILGAKRMSFLDGPYGAM